MLVSPVPQPSSSRSIIEQFMKIKRQVTDVAYLSEEDTTLISRSESRYSTTYIGKLNGNSEAIYDQMDALLAPHNLFAFFRATETDHIIHIIQGRLRKPAPSNPVVPIILFIATVISVMYTGTTIAIGELGLIEPQQAQAVADNILPNLWRGLPYAISILIILGGHEMGHYLQMRRHQVASTLPYFLPGLFISAFGTFGAAIALREPLKNRKVLFDVGASGPLVGFILTLPILLIGLATSQITPISGGLVEGNSVVYLLSKVIVFGRALPDGQYDVLVNQMAWAGWTGLFITAFNLIPVGQLDGGHVLYALVGDYARRFFNPLFAIMIFLTLFVSGSWLFLGALLLIVGRSYAVPLDNITDLDNRRQWLGLAVLVIFGLIFVPVPIAEPGVNAGLLGGLGAVISLSALRKMVR